MSVPSPFRHLIPAQPGWRVVSAWADGGDRPTIDYEPIVAWAEWSDRPGELVPMKRDGLCEMAVFPQEADDLTFLALLAPGEAVDPAGENWKARIKAVLDRQAEDNVRIIDALRAKGIEWPNPECAAREQTGEDRTEGNG